MINFYRELPENYEEFKVIDVKKKSTIIWLNFISFFLVIFSFVPLFLYIVMTDNEVTTHNSINVGLLLLISILGIVFYIPLHELVHGLFYKIFTKEKLTFGFTLSVAFCGVPNIYTTRKTALFATLAPFVVFSIAFLLAVFFIPSVFLKLVFAILFSLHLCGCTGDLYVALILIFSKGKILTNDTGPKQTFYRLK